MTDNSLSLRGAQRRSNLAPGTCGRKPSLRFSPLDWSPRCRFMTKIAMHPRLQRVDEALARQRPFGDSEYIATRLRAVYERRLIKLSDDIPVAGDIVDSLA